MKFARISWGAEVPPPPEGDKDEEDDVDLPVRDAASVQRVALGAQRAAPKPDEALKALEKLAHRLPAEDKKAMTFLLSALQQGGPTKRMRTEPVGQNPQLGAKAEIADNQQTRDNRRLKLAKAEANAYAVASAKSAAAMRKNAEELQKRRAEAEAKQARTKTAVDAKAHAEAKTKAAEAAAKASEAAAKAKQAAKLKDASASSAADASASSAAEATRGDKAQGARGEEAQVKKGTAEAKEKAARAKKAATTKEELEAEERSQEAQKLHWRAAEAVLNAEKLFGQAETAKKKAEAAKKKLICGPQRRGILRPPSDEPEAEPKKAKLRSLRKDRHRLQQAWADLSENEGGADAEGDSGFGNEEEMEVKESQEEEEEESEEEEEESESHQDEEAESESKPSKGAEGSAAAADAEEREGGRKSDASASYSEDSELASVANRTGNTVLNLLCHGYGTEGAVDLPALLAFLQKNGTWRADLSTVWPFSDRTPSVPRGWNAIHMIAHKRADYKTRDEIVEEALFLLLEEACWQGLVNARMPKYNVDQKGANTALHNAVNQSNLHFVTALEAVDKKLSRIKLPDRAMLPDWVPKGKNYLTPFEQTYANPLQPNLPKGFSRAYQRIGWLLSGKQGVVWEAPKGEPRKPRYERSSRSRRPPRHKEGRQTEDFPTSHEGGRKREPSRGFGGREPPSWPRNSYEQRWGGSGRFRQPSRGRWVQKNA